MVEQKEFINHGMSFYLNLINKGVDKKIACKEMLKKLYDKFLKEKRSEFPWDWRNMNKWQR